MCINVLDLATLLMFIVNSFSLSKNVTGVFEVCVTCVKLLLCNLCSNVLQMWGHLTLLSSKDDQFILYTTSGVLHVTKIIFFNVSFSCSVSEVYTS